MWDRTLEFGVQHARGLQTISRVMAHHGFGSQPCPLCEAGDLQVSVYHHLLDIHKHKFGLTDQDPITKLENLDVGFLEVCFLVSYMYFALVFQLFIQCDVLLTVYNSELYFGILRVSIL